MNEHEPTSVETNNKANTLIERLDPSIGEVSTVMGAMMTELIRRALRGSVRQIDDELQEHVDQKLTATIAHRLPAIEQSAAEAADKAARQAATEVAFEEVHALEQRTREAADEMTARIETTARAAEERTAQAASALTDRIELVDKKAESAVTSKAHELTSRIEEAAKTVTTLAEEKARALARDIEEAERRANDTARAETTRQVEDVLEKARKTAAGFKDRLETLEAASAMLDKQVRSEAGDRRTEHMALRAVIDKLQEDQSSLGRSLAEARQQNEALAARVTELESPRGLRALWGRLFGRRKAEPAIEPPVAE